MGDDEGIGTGDILDDTVGRNRRFRVGTGWLDRGCEPECWSAGCEVSNACDGNCLVALITLVATSGGLFAAIAGAGSTGRRLRREAQAPRGALAAALHRGVRYYQLRLSARRPGHGSCRYTPTCSAYAAEALRRHGALEGSRLAARRLRRCRPGTVGGADPVP
jgi:uncharacterized protein